MLFAQVNPNRMELPLRPSAASRRDLHPVEACRKPFVHSPVPQSPRRSVSLTHFAPSVVRMCEFDKLPAWTRQTSIQIFNFLSLDVMPKIVSKHKILNTHPHARRLARPAGNLFSRVQRNFLLHHRNGVNYGRAMSCVLMLRKAVA